MARKRFAKAERFGQTVGAFTTTMGIAIEVVVLGAVIPAAIALVVMLGMTRWIARGPSDLNSPTTVSRHLAAAAFAAAFFVGYQLLPAWANLKPTAWWQWLPYLTLVAGFLGGVRLSPTLSAAERWGVLLLFAGLFAWRVVPGWESLSLPAPLSSMGEFLAATLGRSGLKPAEGKIGYVCLVALYYVAIVVALEPLGSRIPSWQFSLAFCATSSALALVLAVFSSLSFGQTAGLAAAAMGGIMVAQLIVRKGPVWDVRGLVPPWCAVIVTLSFAGFVEPTTPLCGFVLIPLAPLALWITVIGPPGRFTGWRSLTLRASLVLAVLVVAAAAIYMQQNRTEAW